MRKTKTDAIDAYHLGELYYKEDLAPQKKRGVQLLNLRHLTRQHENMTGKPYKVAIIACANKLLHWIYAILKTKTPFQETI
ncbi:hypothetical protein LSPCS325_19230 [Lysinibacillus sp. CTST325]